MEKKTKKIHFEMSLNYFKFVFNTLFMTQKYALLMSVLKRILKNTFF